MNLPMILQAVCLPENITSQDAKDVIEAAKLGAIYMNEYKMTVDEDDE